MRNEFVYTSHSHVTSNCLRDFFPEAGNEEIIKYIPAFARSKGILKRAVFSLKYSKYIPMFIKQRYYNFLHLDFKDDVMYHILISTLTVAKLDIKILESFLKKHKNVRIYAILVDSMDAGSVHMTKEVKLNLLNPLWTSVFTYDKYDAEKYGFDYIGFNIYSTWDFVEADGNYSDCYYVGYNKGNREELTLAIYNYVRAAGIHARFDVVSKTPNLNNDLEYLTKTIQYNEIVSRVKSSNCIIEILQEGQKTQTLRWFEAIAYNKKLLTNNKNISNLPFYNEKYMKYFEKAEDIDIEWLTKKDEIDYGYSGEFSPLNIIDTIKRGVEF